MATGTKKYPDVFVVRLTTEMATEFRRRCEESGVPFNTAIRRALQRTWEAEKETTK
jgi:hypothetical protein